MVWNADLEVGTVPVRPVGRRSATRGPETPAFVGRVKEHVNLEVTSGYK